MSTPETQKADDACPTCGRGGSVSEPSEDVVSEDNDAPEKDGATLLRVPFAEMIRRKGGRV